MMAASVTFIKNGIISITRENMKKIYPQVEFTAPWECQGVLEAHINKKKENLYILDDCILAKLMPE